jgi:hypothetical protein
VEPNESLRLTSDRSTLDLTYPGHAAHGQAWALEPAAIGSGPTPGEKAAAHAWRNRPLEANGW